MHSAFVYIHIKATRAIESNICREISFYKVLSLAGSNYCDFHFFIFPFDFLFATEGREAEAARDGFSYGKIVTEITGGLNDFNLAGLGIFCIGGASDKVGVNTELGALDVSDFVVSFHF